MVVQAVDSTYGRQADVNSDSLKKLALLEDFIFFLGGGFANDKQVFQIRRNLQRLLGYSKDI